ncbi:MAG: TrmH family RNA methyltransferase [Candidatus Magasanikbacteria bacterium]
MNKEINLILPNIRSAHNVGAMFRIADCFGVDKIYLTGYTPTPEDKRKVEKVALGAEKWVEWEKIENVDVLISDLKNNNFEVVCLENTNDSVDVKKADFTDKIALIVGEEVSGVNSELLGLCDKSVFIPMHGKKSSLNVSVATGVALHSIIS